MLLTDNELYEDVWYMLKINGSWINLFLWSDEQSKSTIDFEFVQLDSYLVINMSMHSVGLVFNILTLIVISRFKARSRSYILMAVLAIADIGSCLVSFFIYFRACLWSSKFHTRFTVCLMQTIYNESMIGFGASVYLRYLNGDVLMNLKVIEGL